MLHKSNSYKKWWKSLFHQNKYNFCCGSHCAYNSLCPYMKHPQATIRVSTGKVPPGNNPKLVTVNDVVVPQDNPCHHQIYKQRCHFHVYLCGFKQSLLEYLTGTLQTNPPIVPSLTLLASCRAQEEPLKLDSFLQLLQENCHCRHRQIPSSFQSLNGPKIFLRWWIVIEKNSTSKHIYFFMFSSFKSEALRMSWVKLITVGTSILRKFQNWFKF